MTRTVGRIADANAIFGAMRLSEGAVERGDVAADRRSAYTAVIGGPGRTPLHRQQRVHWLSSCRLRKGFRNY